MDLQQEKLLIKKAKHDPKAFEELYDRYYPKIFNYILKRIRLLDLAQDITSEVFFKAFKGLWKFQFRNIPFSAWLYRIAGNEICNYLKKGTYKNISLDEILEQNGFEPASEEDFREELKEAERIQETNQIFYEIQAIMQKLSDKHQMLIHLKFFEKKTAKEIGQIMGMREGTVKSGLSRALTKLRYLVENMLKKEPASRKTVMDDERFKKNLSSREALLKSKP